MATSAPAPARAKAEARPRRFAPPVTSATLPASGLLAAMMTSPKTVAWVEHVWARQVKGQPRRGAGVPAIPNIGTAGDEGNRLHRIRREVYRRLVTGIEHGALPI